MSKMTETQGEKSHLEENNLLIRNAHLWIYVSRNLSANVLSNFYFGVYLLL